MKHTFTVTLTNAEGGKLLLQLPIKPSPSGEGKSEALKDIFIG